METILIVDDEEENLMMVEHILENDYNVVAVNSGEMALKYLHQEIPDLILLDIKMPQMDGFEVLNTIRQKKEWMKIPVIFLTSYKNNYNSNELLESGVADYIGKPIDTANMKRRIRYAMINMRTGFQQNMLPYKILKIKNNDVSFSPLMQQDTLTLPVLIDHIEVSLPINKIVYVELVHRKCIVYTKHMEVKTKLSLDKISSMVGKSFILLNKSILINKNFIRHLGETSLIMENGKEFLVPISKRSEFSSIIREKMYTIKD